MFIVGLLVCGTWSLCFGQSSGKPSPAPAPPAKRQGFFDYALGKINPNGNDYGAAAGNVRDAAVSHTIDDLYFWSNVLTLLLLTGACGAVLFQWRSAEKREVIAVSLIVQLWNGRVSDRTEIERRTEQYNRLVETHNAEVERALMQRPANLDQEKDADLSRNVRKVAAKSPAGNGSTQLRLSMGPAPETAVANPAELEQNNLLLQRRVEALQNSEQNLKQRLNQTTVLLDQERRRNSALKGA
jgi:hypothetical protein